MACEPECLGDAAASIRCTSSDLDSDMRIGALRFADRRARVRPPTRPGTPYLPQREAHITTRSSDWRRDPQPDAVPLRARRRRCGSPRGVDVLQGVRDRLLRAHREAFSPRFVASESVEPLLGFGAGRFIYAFAPCGCSPPVPFAHGSGGAEQPDRTARIPFEGDPRESVESLAADRAEHLGL